jgi:hypothetical protein
MKKIIPLLIMLLLFSSCESQIGTAIGAAFNNLVTGAGFSNSSSDQLYDQMKQDAIANPLTTTLDGSCVNPENALSVLGKPELKNMSMIKDKLCTCQAWGNCDRLSCTCDSLCPKNFEILNRTENATNDSLENSLSFTNSDPQFYKDDSNYSGYCWGHALVTQRFNRLAKFESRLPKKFASDELSSERLREYKYIIKRINNNEPVDIPGFKNLNEFSSDPEVKGLLRDSVKENWAANAMSTQGLSMIASGEPQGADYYNKLFDDLEFRFDHHQSPAIVFNDKNQATDAHTVLVNGHGTTAEGLRYICIRDNNFVPEKSYDCKNKMILGKEGTISYGPWSPKAIGKVKLSFTENSNTVEQIKNLRTKCLGDKKCIAETSNSL